MIILIIYFRVNAPLLRIPKQRLLHCCWRRGQKNS